jgi:putative flippase GtrA
MLVSYRGSRSWAFRDRAAVGVAGGRVMFFVINIASMVIPLGCLAFTRYVLGLTDPVADNVSANVVGLALGTLARFIALKRFIFLSPARIELRDLAARRDSLRSASVDAQH